jgi:signal transduction histidine kinase
MHPITRLSLIAGLLLAFGAAALLLQTWVGVASPTGLAPASDPRQSEFAHRQQLAAATLTLLALASITAAAVLPRPLARPTGDGLSRQGIELLARTAATQSEALVRERDVRQRTEENLAMEQMRAGQAVADKVRLGRDLHDGMIQSLYATGLTLAAARSKISTEPGRAAELLDRGVELLNATIRDMRTAIGGLSAARQQEQSFPAAVDLVLEMLGSGRAVVFDTRIEDTAAARVAEAQIPDLLQIIREAVSNALRHGAASTVTVRLSEDQGSLCLLVQDDGHGFNPGQTAEGGHGLGNLHARAELLRGELQLTSRPGTGTRVVLTFPVAPTPA